MLILTAHSCGRRRCSSQLTSEPESATVSGRTQRNRPDTQNRCIACVKPRRSAASAPGVTEALVHGRPDNCNEIAKTKREAFDRYQELWRRANDTNVGVMNAGDGRCRAIRKLSLLFLLTLSSCQKTRGPNMTEVMR